MLFVWCLGPEAVLAREDAVPMNVATCGAYLQLLELGGGVEMAPNEPFWCVFGAFSAWIPVLEAFRALDVRREGCGG